MTLNKLKVQVKCFEKQAGFDKTKPHELIKMLQKELNDLKNSRKETGHKLIDIQVLLLQLANRYKTNLNAEWKKHWKKSRKYLK